MNDLLNALNTYGIVLNSLMTFITITVSVLTVILTYSNSKKEQRRFEEGLRVSKAQYEENLKVQKEQFEIQLKHSEEVIILQEQPYFVFKGGSISEESDENFKRIDFVFKNKGRGSAYSLMPPMKCEANSIKGKKELSRCDAVQDSIAMVGENFTTMFTLGYGEPLESFETMLTICYKDASGRKYNQAFDIIFNKEGYASVKNYAEPELV